MYSLKEKIVWSSQQMQKIYLITFIICGRLNVHILLPRTYEYNALNCKRDLVDVISLRILIWAYYPGLSGLGQCNHKNPYKRGAGRSVSEKKMWQQKQKLAWCKVMNKGVWTTSRSWKRQGNIFSHRALKSSAPLLTHFWASDLQDCKIIHLYCFKPLSLWQFVTTAIGN